LGWSSLEQVKHPDDVEEHADVGSLLLRSERMGVLDKLKNVGNYVRKGWRSTGPDSYFQYRQGRERQRKEAERGREYADRSAELEREKVQRGREYDERYAAERAAEESRTKAPRDDASKPV
jgi:hypothetical protein